MTNLEALSLHRLEELMESLICSYEETGDESFAAEAQRVFDEINGRTE